jgi:cation transport ATPase
VLVEIAELFGVSLDDLVKSDAIEQTTISPKPQRGKYNRRAISYVSESTGWVIAIIAFIITTLILGEMSFQWLYFIYALPVVLIVRLIFNSVWFNPRHNYLIISLLMWSILSAIHITFLYFDVNVSLIFLLGVAGEIVIVLWSFINKPRKQ